MELAPFGINVTLVGPGPYATDSWGSSLAQSQPQPQYDAMREMVSEAVSKLEWEDPAVATQTLLRVVDSDHPQGRMILGATAYDQIIGVTNQRMQTWKDWESLSRES